MNQDTFFSSITSALRLDADETIPQYDNGLVFSYGSNLPKIVVTVKPEAFDSFLDASNKERAEITTEVFKRF